MIRRALVAVALVVAACSAREDGVPPRQPAPQPVAATTAVPVPPPAVPAATAPPPASPSPPVPARAERIELTFMGDVIFGGYFDDHYDPQEVEVHDPLAGMDALIASDLPFANFETTITRTLPNGGKDHDGKGHKRFVTIPERVAILPRHGIKTVTLANNHQHDNDAKGLVETPEILRELGIAFVGAARSEPPTFRVETIEVKGWKIGFIPATTELNRRQRKGATPAIAYTPAQTLQQELVPVIEAARATHDLVILQLHWGVQYADVPSAWQVKAAHAFIDAGADAVIGHHPHVLQAMERYRDGLVAYSLGNFVFPNGKERVRDTGVLRLGFRAGASGRPCLELAAFHPAMQNRRPITHPEPATGEKRAIIERRLFALSAARPFATKWRVEGDRFVTDAACR